MAAACRAYKRSKKDTCQHTTQKPTAFGIFIKIYARKRIRVNTLQVYIRRVGKKEAVAKH